MSYPKPIKPALTLPHNILQEFMVDVFSGLGCSDKDATICADVLITSDLRGFDSHGVGRLKMYYDRIKAGLQSPKTKIDVIKEGPTTLVLDGNLGMGHVIAHNAMSRTIDKAKKAGLGATAVRNSTHYGIAGYYALMATKNNMIGITCTNARPSIAPTFGVEPMLGTNPLTIGIPSNDPFPFVLDAATSISQRGKIEVLDRLHKPVPSGWVINREGKTLTNASDILKLLIQRQAALLPLGGLGELLGGHKGYGYATVVEILSSALQDGAFLKQLSGFDKDGKRIPYRIGHFFLVINIAHFLPVSRFKVIVSNILRELRHSEKIPNQSTIYTAGEKEYKIEQNRRKTGIPITKRTLEQIRTMRDELQLTQYQKHF